jgi:LPXTG-motif cell wall-anchored protein
VTLLSACEAEVTLETAPQAISSAANPSEECQGAPYWKADNWTDDEPYWNGAVEASQPPGDGAISLDLSDYPETVRYSNNSGMDIVAVYVKAGSSAYPVSTGGSFTWTTPPAISHVTFCFEEGGEPTTVPPTEPTTTTTEASTTTTEASTTTSEATTTTSEADGDTTSTLNPAEVTTTAGESSTTSASATTIPDSGTTLPDAGATTTLADGQTTTTAEVGAGTLEPGQETSTTGEGGGTGDPGETTTTAGDDVEGGASESTLPYTGVGDMTTGGMAGLLVAAGIVLLLFARRKSDAE